jgi:anti-anti-sigma factor
MATDIHDEDPLGPVEESFAYEVVPERDTARIRVTGSVDMATVPELDAQLRELCAAGFRRIVLDLSALDFMDSTGLRLILRWDAEARRDGLAFALVPGGPAVQRLFEITQTAAHLPFVAR